MAESRWGVVGNPEGVVKEIEIIHRLFLVIGMYCQASSSQFNESLNLPPKLAGWEQSLGTCSR